MASQVALHPQLSNPFIFADLKSESMASVQSRLGDFHDVFESGKIFVLDGLPVENLDFFLDHPGKWYPDWIPPIFSQKIKKKLNPDHALRPICENDQDILEFQQRMEPFEQSWLHHLFALFPRYQWEKVEFSYRFNHLALGSLHLDVPERLYETHQFRWFMNMDRRPRILSVGPTIFELAELYWEEKQLWRFADLPVHEFIGALRAETLDKTINRERGLPRHYLTLDPGALWLAHSSYISHGIVYGRKTTCLEGQILPNSLKSPSRHFNSLVRALQKYGPRVESELQSYANLL